MEKQRSNSDQSKRGANFKGKKMGNNLSLETAIQPTPEQKSNGWSIRNALLKGVKEIAEFAENTKFETVIVDGQEVQMSMLAYAYYMQLKKAIDKSDTQAFLAYIKATEGFTSKHALVNQSHPTILFSKSEDEILRDLMNPTIELSKSDTDTDNIIIQMIKKGAKLV